MTSRFPQSHQLATHDDLAAQLKIAQSNLALAETHSEFLEDTLRRRESLSSGSHAMAPHHSGPGTQRRGSADTNESGGLGGLFGLGLSGDAEANGGAKSFFRLPSKRKPTPSNSSSNSMPAPNSRGLRSVASSPLLKDASPNPASPTDQPRFSTSTFSSIDESSLSVPVNGGGNSPTFSRELFALQTQVSSLETECAALRSNNGSLKRSNETLVGKCAELEKTTEDLMSELENLSVELFSEANTLVRPHQLPVRCPFADTVLRQVADERKARAKADEEVERLQAEVDSLNLQLSALRLELAHRPSIHDIASPALPALPHSAPTTPALSMSSDSLQPYSASPDRMPAPARADTDRERPVSAATGRRWFPFSRASNVGEAPAAAPPHSTSAPPSTLQAPVMARGDSGSSHVSDTSATSFFSTRSGPARSASSAHERSPVMPAEVQRRATAPTAKGKEKARELDLGIRVPSSAGGEWMARTESDGGTTVGAKTPGTAVDPHKSLDAAMQQPLSPNSRSPGLKPSAATPAPASLPSSTLAPSVSLPSAQDDATPIPDRATPVFAGPRLRPPRSSDGTAAPRPLAIHTNVTPPMLAGGFSHPVDPSRIGGPTAAEMTAASKSPKSPNELRWNKVAGSIDSNGASSSSSRARSNSRSSVDRAGEGRRWDRENLPPSPALPEGFEQQQQQQQGQQPSVPAPGRRSTEERAETAVLQDAPVPRVQVPAPTPASITARLRLDTSIVRLGPSVPTSGSKPQRSPSAQAAASLGSRPTLTRAASTTDAVPFPTTVSTAQAAASSGPASAAPTTRPTYLRANSSSSLSGGRAGAGAGGGGGITPSTSASSLASRSSASSGAALLSPGGASSSSGRAHTPDGTRTVEDLDNLMRSIVEMSEGLFDKEDEERDGAGTGTGKGLAQN